MESSFSFTVFCLSVCFKIFIFFFYFKEIHVHRLRYRGPDCQVGKPIERVTVFKVTGEFSTPIKLGSNQYLFIEITT